jgi:hypothetical protein
MFGRTTPPANGQHLAVSIAGRSQEVCEEQLAGIGTKKGDGGMDRRVIR